MAPFPKGHEALVAAGYLYLSASTCKAEGCGYQIYWYKAPPGQIMPIDAGTQEPHWKVCCGAKAFRKKARAAAKPEPVQLQRNMFDREPGED